MSYVVYVLRDEEGNLYKGMTNDMARRLREHRAGKTKTTRQMNALEIVYVEKFDDIQQARKREVYFKTAAGRRFLKEVL